jgi:hypothetical protein
MTAYEQIQTQVYVTSLDNVMLIVTWSSVVGWCSRSSSVPAPAHRRGPRPRPTRSTDPA